MPKECVIRTAQPLLIGLVVKYFSQPNFEGKVSPAMAYWAIFGICATTITYSTTKHHWYLTMQRYGMKAKTALTILIYKKVLKLSKNSFEKTSVSHRFSFDL